MGIQILKKYNGVDDKIYLRKVAAIPNRNMLRKREKMLRNHCRYWINVCVQRKLDKETVMHVLVVVIVAVVVVVVA